MALPTNRTLALSEINKAIQFTNGNVGIGTTTPNSKLDVSGGIQGTSITTSSLIATTQISTGTVNSTSLNSTNANITNISASNLNVTTFSPSSISSGTLSLSTGLTSANANITTETVGTSRVTTSLLALGNSNTIGSIITTGGNVGINTASPTYTLDAAGQGRVFSNATSSNFYIGNGSYNARLNFWDAPGSGWRLETDGSQLIMANGTIGSTSTVERRLTIGSTGNLLLPGTGTQSFVGIGTTAPGFGVGGSTGAWSNLTIRGGAFGGNDGTGELLIGGNSLHYSSIVGMHVGNGQTTLSFRTCTAVGNPGERMKINESGNVYVWGALSKGSGSFDIKHPILENTRLVHSFVEGPRCDLIYRGVVQLTNGTAIVNLDTDCVAESDCAMTQGTFESLCANPQYFLQNHSSFNRLKGVIQNNILTITCENVNSTDTIYWSVIAERKDPFIKSWERTNTNGYLKTEYTSGSTFPA